ncbi:MAG: hypothetical protein ACHQFX_09070 [Chitinophagales bacterium]
MQRLIQMLITLITTVVIGSIVFVRCNSGTAANASGNDAAITKKASDPITGINVIEFKVNGQPVKTSGWNISRFGFKGNSAEWLNITTNMHDEKRTINVNLSGAVPGSYSFGEVADLKGQSRGSFFPNYMGDMTNSFSFTKGMFNITEVDTVGGKISGVFWGTVRNLKGETLEITDGKIINGSLQSRIMKYE